MWRAGHRLTWHKAKHKPSGILIVWLGNDNKTHTQSIGLHSQVLPTKIAEIDAKAALLLRQLDYLGGLIKSKPVITAGLTRIEAKQALLSELRLPLLPTHTPSP